MKHIGNKIREIRNGREISGLAKKAGWSRQRWYSVEQQRNVRTDTAQACAKALGVELTKIFS